MPALVPENAIGAARAAPSRCGPHRPGRLNESAGAIPKPIITALSTWTVQSREGYRSPGPCESCERIYPSPFHRTAGSLSTPEQAPCPCSRFWPARPPGQVRSDDRPKVSLPSLHEGIFSDRAVGVTSLPHRIARDLSGSRSCRGSPNAEADSSARLQPGGRERFRRAVIAPVLLIFRDERRTPLEPGTGALELGSQVE